MAKKKKKNYDPNNMTFLQHLDELRGHLIRSILAVLAFSVIAFMIKDIIFDQVLFAPRDANFFSNRMFCKLGHLLNTDKLCINTEHFEIINIELAGQFRTHLKISFLGGIIMSAPYIFYEVWRFIAPALKSKEKKHSRGMVFFTSLLFMIGIMFGFFLIIPLTINFLGGYSVSMEVENQINMKSYIATVSTVTLSTGLVFELPILIYFLSKVGLITPDFLRTYRKHSIIIFFILAGIITPPDVISQVLVAMPLYLLFEISILISARIERKRAKELEDDDDDESDEDQT